ncbi:MAG: helix-turn-helix transcriptional regulator [Hyphomicrobiaceae bacterium]|nr:helix-turn-helix transcriptional regulator [Hyphomicrobiaceae bacterium]
MINDDNAVKALSALGHDVRLHLFRLLVRAGDGGLNVGQIGTHLGVPPSTLAHHLSALVDAGLVRQERQGRQIVNRADYGRIDALVGFLTDECCCGVAIDPAADNDAA